MAFLVAASVSRDQNKSISGKMTYVSEQSMDPACLMSSDFKNRFLNPVCCFAFFVGHFLFSEMNPSVVPWLLVHIPLFLT